MNQNTHEYSVSVVWEGNRGEGTAGYEGYGRQYRVVAPGKADLAGSADPLFRGDAALHNPESLFVASISACHMLTYLALCARRGITVLSYRDMCGAILLLEGGGGRFSEVTLRPEVTIDASSDAEEAMALHERAHELCFIANSCSVPIACVPVVERA